jgi:Holliday junction resolvase RusA-like endonuclease
MEVSFTVPGDPKGKQRPYSGKDRNGNTVMFTPAQTVRYENLVKTVYQFECRGKRLNGAIEAVITGVFSVPKSESKKKREAMLSGKIHYTKKIDCDNLAKIILDSLNKIAFEDDKQVCSLIVKKEYGEEPMVRVTLREIGE